MSTKASTSKRSSATKSATAKPPATDAVKLLSADHKEVHGLFKEYAKVVAASAPAGARQQIAHEICALLTVHATVEEEIFYPAARAAGIEHALLDEAEVEHATAKELIAQLESMEAGDELYDAKVTVLGEYIDHHVKEEQDEIFPACRKARMDLVALGAELEARKAELVNDMSAEAA
jgi:hemerythrin superfamily protein